MSWLSTCAAIFLGFSAAVTPLGLHTRLELSRSEETPFSYAKDLSPIGQGTPRREDYDFNRLCGQGVCPGNAKGYAYLQTTNVTDKLINNPYASNKISANITAVFAFDRPSGKEKKPKDHAVDTGTKHSVNTVTTAGFFDIQYRTYLKLPGSTVDTIYPALEDEVYTVALPSYYQQFLLNSRVEAIEGLIVSSGEMPGIGFRNHTLPPESKNGYEWSEEILWLEPETACTNLNITFDYTYMTSAQSLTGTTDARITDRGGLQHLPDAWLLPLSRGDGKQDPQLLLRSWHSAVWTNKLLVEFLRNQVNISEQQREYFMRDVPTYGDGSFEPTPNRIEFSTFGRRGPAMKDPNLPGPLQVFGSRQWGDTGVGK